MIKHIVMWKFKEEAEGCTKAENIAKVKAMLEALPEKIDFIREMQVNVNVNPKESIPDLSSSPVLCTIKPVFGSPLPSPAPLLSWLWWLWPS